METKTEKEDEQYCKADDLLTTYRAHYIPFRPYNFPKIANKKPQSDPMLLTGHFQNNILVNGHSKKSNVWPESNYGVEEYTAFVEKLERCKKTIYEMFFENCPLDLDIIEAMLKDLQKTVYQVSYSPNAYVTVSERKRVQLDPTSANMKYHETTYRTYYNRIEELERFKKYMVTKLCKVDREAIKDKLNRIYLAGRSTYYTTICLPAIAMAKTKKMLESPVDVHTWRRV